jgi:hypothetical protein
LVVAEVDVGRQVVNSAPRAVFQCLSADAVALAPGGPVESGTTRGGSDVLPRLTVFTDGVTLVCIDKTTVEVPESQARAPLGVLPTVSVRELQRTGLRVYAEPLTPTLPVGSAAAQMFADAPRASDLGRGAKLVGIVPAFAPTQGASSTRVDASFLGRAVSYDPLLNVIFALVTERQRRLQNLNTVLCFSVEC